MQCTYYCTACLLNKVVIPFYWDTKKAAAVIYVMSHKSIRMFFKSVYWFSAIKVKHLFWTSWVGGKGSAFVNGLSVG